MVDALYECLWSTIKWKKDGYRTSIINLYHMSSFLPNVVDIMQKRRVDYASMSSLERFERACGHIMSIILT
jgi:hypothetical protein